MPQYRLRFALSEGPWEEKILEYGEYTLGRSADCDIVLAEIDISRVHAKLEVGAEGVFIMDNGSANGTYIDGKPLPPKKKKPLAGGQIFTIVNYHLMVETTGAETMFGTAVQSSTAGEQPSQISTPSSVPSGIFKAKTQLVGEVPPGLGPTQLPEGASKPSKGTTPTPLAPQPPQQEDLPTQLESLLTLPPTPPPPQSKVQAGPPPEIQTRVTPTPEAQTRVSPVESHAQSPQPWQASTRVSAAGMVQVQSGPFSEYLLRYRKGDDPWASQPLTFGEYTLGRTSECDFILPEIGVSRRHARLEVGPEAAFIIDLGSANGTQIDGLPLFPRQKNRIYPNQIITLDVFSLMVEGIAEGALVPQMDGAESEIATQVEISAVPQQVTLCIRKDKDGWEEKTLAPGEYVIGRVKEADIPLVDDGISRRHAKLEVNTEGVFITDLGSSNGTKVDKTTLEANKRASLLEGQLVTLGRFTLAIKGLAAIIGAQTNLKSVTTGKTSPELARTRVSTGPAKTAPILVRFRKGSDPTWHEYSLQQGEQTIGRGTDAHIRLDSQVVSRHHARVTLRGQQVFITDLGSKNGVQINGVSLNPNQDIVLTPGTLFQIDEFTFEFLGASSAQAASALSTQVAASAFLGEAAKDGATVIGADLGADLRKMLSMPAQQAPINLMGQDRISIGREPDNQIVLDHPLVSRYHAIIERLGNRTRITDTHSANGVFINGEPVVEQAWLKQGDLIKVGPYQIDFTGNELRHSAVAESYTIDVIGINKWVTKKLNLLQDINLCVGQNEFVALVGMSGAGKSTLMDAINGFRPATHGKVLVNGVDLYTNYGMFRDDIGNVPQKDIVHNELNAEQALDYAAQLRMPADTRAKERKKAVDETLEDLGLTARRKVPISRLSGGQLKRVSIGVELLTKPRLFFLDEPTSGLDPGTEYEMMKLLRRLADQGRTIMIITHATKNVMFCDKAIILARGGNLAFYGPPEEALEYFDTFRTKRERLEKDMEFDDIYRILNDNERGKPEDWRKRYLESKYAKYTQPKRQPEKIAAPVKGAGRAQRGKRITQLRQFFILSARNLRCLFQDKASLGFTLALAPILGMMNFMWGQNLFDPVNGDTSKVMGMWFITSVIAVVVGAMGSVREIVKENDIYKRERAVGLKIFPYVTSKVWIGMALAIYQGTVIFIFLLLLVQPKAEFVIAYPAFLVTLILAVICSYLLGLMVSALAPNQNSAQIILIAFLVPQFLFAGVLQPLNRIPLGEQISVIISSRWSFEAFVNASGLGSQIDKDPCWQLDREQRISLDAKTKQGECLCMGPQIFQNCASVPGMLSPDYYDVDAQEMLVATEPVQPADPAEEPSRIPSPTRYPTPTLLATPTYLPSPTFLPTPTSVDTPTPYPFSLSYKNSGCEDYPKTQAYSVEGETCIRNNTNYRLKKYQDTQEAQMHEYQLTREAQFEVYREDTLLQVDEYRANEEKAVREYKGQVEKQLNTFVEQEKDKYEAYGESAFKQFEDYAEYFKGYVSDMESYGDERALWERTRLEAIGAAEAILGRIYDDYGRAFRGTYITRWVAIALISLGEFIIILILMKRKDVI